MLDSPPSVSISLKFFLKISSLLFHILPINPPHAKSFNPGFPIFPFNPSLLCSRSGCISIVRHSCSSYNIIFELISEQHMPLRNISIHSLCSVPDLFVQDLAFLVYLHLFSRRDKSLFAPLFILPLWIYTSLPLYLHLSSYNSFKYESKFEQ